MYSILATALWDKTVFINRARHQSSGKLRASCNQAPIIFAYLVLSSLFSGRFFRIEFAFALRTSSYTAAAQSLHQCSPQFWNKKHQASMVNETGSQIILLLNRHFWWSAHNFAQFFSTCYCPLIAHYRVVIAAKLPCLHKLVITVRYHLLYMMQRN